MKLILESWGTQARISHLVCCCAWGQCLRSYCLTSPHSPVYILIGNSYLGYHCQDHNHKIFGLLHQISGTPILITSSYAPWVILTVHSLTLGNCDLKSWFQLVFGNTHKICVINIVHILFILKRMKQSITHSLVYACIFFPCFIYIYIYIYNLIVMMNLASYT